MVVLQRSLDKSVQHTLRLLLIMLASLMVLAVGSTVLSTQYLSGRLSTVYDDRLLPLDDLQTISRILSVDVPVLLQDPVPEQQRPALSAHWANVQLLWAKYRITELTEKEAVLAGNFEASLPRLYRQVLEAQALPLAADYRALLAPLLAQLHALSDLQLDVAKEELGRARRASWLAHAGGVVLAALGLGLVLLAMRIMADNIVRPLGLVASAVAGLAGGTSEGPPPELQQLSGDFAAVGDQLRHLRVFMAERQQLLQQEQQGRRQLQEAQEELVEAEKLASLGALVAGVAHELNTPLGVAVAVSSSLGGKLRHFEAELANGPLRRSMLDGLLADLHEATLLMERNLARAAEMVRSFKQVAVDRSGMQRRSFDLAGMVDELLASLRPVYGRQGRELLNALPAGLLLDSYPGALGQVLSNLIANAVLHGLQDRPGQVRVELHGSTESAVELCISDDGAGMSPELQARIFEPFFTTRMGQGGSGLGLPIVRNLVMGVLGGRIRLNSSPGAGTRVFLSLPRSAPQRPESLAPARGHLPSITDVHLPGSSHVADPSAV